MEKQYYIGLDVHKLNTVYAVKDWNGQTVTTGKIATDYEDLKSVLERYLDKCKISLEASTSYYKLYQDFKQNGYSISVANTIKLRRLIGKDDIVDAIRLADMDRLGNLPTSYIPEKNVQSLRNMISLYHRFVQNRTKLKNQIHANLDRNGIKISVRTPFSKKWLVGLQEQLANVDSIELRYLFETEQDMSKRVDGLKIELIGYAKREFKRELELVTSITGIGELLGSYILAEVLPITRFESKKKLNRYAGVIPVTNKSDGKIYATYLPKTASRKLLRYALVEAANAAIKQKGRLQEYFKKKKKGRKYGQAIMCVARTISDLVYAVLTKNKPYEK